jgi:hypothetical protein
LSSTSKEALNLSLAASLIRGDMSIGEGTVPVVRIMSGYGMFEGNSHSITMDGRISVSKCEIVPIGRSEMRDLKCLLTVFKTYHVATRKAATFSIASRGGSAIPRTVCCARFRFKFYEVDHQFGCGGRICSWPMSPARLATGSLLELKCLQGLSNRSDLVLRRGSTKGQCKFADACRFVALCKRQALLWLSPD